VPYNINPPCPSGGNAEITFKVANQSGSIVKTNGDDYRIITEVIPSRSQYKSTVSWVPAHKAGIQFPVVSKEIFVPGAMTGERVYDRQLLPGYTFEVTRNAFLRREDNSDTATLGDWNLVTFHYGNIVAAKIGSINFSNFEKTNATYSGYTKHTAEIYKNGVLIGSFFRTGAETISATWKCINQCPPNTCDVLCGNTICCYNSDGISVFNYPNT
jgi:hypothetical protein